jgi:predicted GIY-YIG superfamily endonuclease
MRTKFDKTEPRHIWLYVLELEQQKYYIGITASTPEWRMQQHINGFAGARWTRKYEPLKIIERRDLGITTYTDAELIENKATREYIKKFGLNNVRGGDITDDNDYIKRFGWLWTKGDWETITIVTLLCLVIIYLTIDKFFY